MAAKKWKRGDPGNTYLIFLARTRRKTNNWMSSMVGGLGACAVESSKEGTIANYSPQYVLIGMLKKLSLKLLRLLLGIETVSE